MSQTHRRRPVGQNLEAPQLFRSQLVRSEEGPGAGAPPGAEAGASVELLSLQCRMVKENCVRCGHFQLAKDSDGGIESRRILL